MRKVLDHSVPLPSDALLLLILKVSFLTRFLPEPSYDLMLKIGGQVLLLNPSS